MKLIQEAENIRILLTVLVFFLPIPLYVKISIGWILDRLDCMSDGWPHKGPLFSSDTSVCKTREYSRYDKIGDTVLNLLVLIASHRYFPEYTPLLTTLFIIRSVGVIRYFKTENKHEFIYFPNLFITTALVLSITGKITPTLFSGICVYQIIQELYIHG